VYWTYGYSPVFGDDGRIGGTLVVCTETTQQGLRRQEAQRADQAAGVARGRAGTLFQKAPALVGTLRGSDHVFEMVNPLYQQLVGEDRQLVGKAMRDALPEVAAQGFIDNLDRAYRDGTPFIGRETFVRLHRQARDLKDAYVTFVYQP